MTKEESKAPDDSENSEKENLNHQVMLLNSRIKHHMIRNSARDEEKMHYDTRTNNSQSVAENRNKQLNLFPSKQSKINTQSETKSSQDTKNPNLQSSMDVWETFSDITELRSPSENKESFVSTHDQIKSLQDAKPIVKEIKNIQEIKRDSVNFADLIEDNPIIPKEESFCKKKNENPEINETVLDERIETGSSQRDFSRAEKHHYERNVKNREKLQNKIAGSESKSSQQSSVSKYSRKTSSIQNEQGTKPMSVRYTKSTGHEQSHNPKGAGRCGNRDIFERGVEESLNPSQENLPTEGDEIEYLPIDTPESHVIITPSDSIVEEPGLTTLTVQIRTMFGLVIEFWRLFKMFSIRQLAKAPLFYFFSSATILLNILFYYIKVGDGDVIQAIMIAFGGFILVTLFFDRGQCSPDSKILEGKTFLGLYDKSSKTINWSFCCACCRSPEIEIERRHSQYRHLEEDTDTTFEHEIADISNIDPNDCPQMRMVEQEDAADSTSPDYSPVISQVNADVHVPSRKRNPEKLGAGRKSYGKSRQGSVTKSHQEAKSSAYYSRNLSKARKADACFSKTSVVFIDECSKHHGKVVSIGSTDLSPILETAPEATVFSPKGTSEESYVADFGMTSSNQEGTSTGEQQDKKEFSRSYKSHSRLTGISKKGHSPQTVNVSDTSKLLSLSKEFVTDEIETIEEDASVSDTSSIEEFICEHYGQGVACACPEIYAKESKKGKYI